MTGLRAGIVPSEGTPSYGVVRCALILYFCRDFSDWETPEIPLDLDEFDIHFYPISP